MSYILIYNDHNISYICIQSRFCSNLNLNREIKNTATCIAMKALEMDLVPGLIYLCIGNTH